MRMTKTAGAVVLAGLAGAVSPSYAAPAPPAAPKSPDAQARETWRATIARTPLPEEGCFKADYPDAIWKKTDCKVAPNRPYMPRHGQHGYTVGNGNDYSAVVSSIITSAVGSFPTVTGVTHETGYDGEANTYSLQLNSEFFTTTVCNGSSDPSNCLGWQQFVYSNSGTAFMQYWLINYGSDCPSGGWMAYEGSCYRNSNAVSVPTQAITKLEYLKITGSAVKAGSDKLVMTTESSAYSTTGSDSVVRLAYSWNAGEFNVVGDGGGSSAKFNNGSSVTVEIAIKDGSTAAPSCEGDDGTTGETNNLTLGSCTTAGGSTPSVKFTERR